ncbi:MAG TPA: hypothetical protein VGO61_03065 [Steroidobacteraceae bacterium]|jgi:hypothetical protein|nr:hypothetical protein [Steroidobacteraceae bacterium]
MLSIASRLSRFALPALGAFLMCACGGGGGGGGSSSSGGGGSSSGGPATGGSFSVSATSISIASKYLTAAPDPVIITAHIADNDVAVLGAGYKPNVTPAPWLDVGASQRGRDVDFIFGVSSSGTAATPGTYTTTVTLGSANSAGTILQTRDISVTLVVRDGVRISSFAIVAGGFNGDSNAAQPHTITVAGPSNQQWTATSSVPWLTVPAGTQTGTGDFTVNTDYGSVRSGNYEGLLTLTNVADHTDVATQRIYLNVQPSCPDVRFNSGNVIGGETGLDTADVPVSISIGNGARIFPYTVSAVTASGGNWFRFTSTGTGTGAWSDFQMNANRSGLASGIYDAQVTVMSTINGEQCVNTVPVHLHLESNRLLVTATGVAFSKFPSHTVLARTLHVLDTRHEGDVNWVASDNASWLTVTSAGNTAGAGGELTLTANPAGLAAGQYFANVSITPVDSARAMNTQTVRVGFTIRAADPPATVDIPASIGFVAANPVEPEFYVANQTAFTLEARDAYSGVLLRSYPSLAFTSYLTVSGDGLSLFGSSGGAIFEMNPATGVEIRHWDMFNGRGGLLYGRPDGHPVLFTSNNITIDLEDNLIRGDNNDTTDPVALSADQRVIYGIDPFGGELRGWTAHYSSLIDSRVRYGRAGVAETDGSFSFGDVALSPLHNRLFAGTQGTIRRIESRDASTFVTSTPLDCGDMPVYFLEASWNGRVAAMTSAATSNIWIYDDVGNFVAQRDSGAGIINYLTKALVFSGDGSRLLSGNDSVGRIQAVP